MMLMIWLQFNAPSLLYDGRWYWSHNRGLDPQMSKDIPFPYNPSASDFTRPWTALYRSRDRTLPDFSKMKDSDFQVFFDVSVDHCPSSAWIIGFIVAECFVFWWNSVNVEPQYVKMRQIHGLCRLPICECYISSRSKDNCSRLVKGSDFKTVYIRYSNSPFTKGCDHDNDPGRLSEEIRYVKFCSICWSPDSSGIFYQVWPPNYNAQSAILTPMAALSWTWLSIPWDWCKFWGGWRWRHDLLSSSWLTAVYVHINLCSLLLTSA
jgi:prolyl oligopeptidase